MKKPVFYVSKNNKGAEQLRICTGYTVTMFLNVQVVFEPRCEKTGFWGVRPGLTQTRLFSLRRWLEA